MIDPKTPMQKLMIELERERRRLEANLAHIHSMLEVYKQIIALIEKINAE